MLKRCKVAIAVVLMAIGSAGSALAGEALRQPPGVLNDQIKDGAIPDRSWGWMRGAFPDASTLERQQWQEIETWLKDCAAHDAADVKQQLSALGIANPVLPGGVTTTQACAQAMALKGAVDKQKSWAEFDAQMVAAAQMLDAYLFGAANTLRHSPYDKGWANEAGWLILRSTTYDQALRTAFSWEMAADAPKLPDGMKRYLLAQLASRTIAQDFENTAMLKGAVAKDGWPKRSASVAVSEAAWLLAQHADQDPAFQLRALRMMEPLVAGNEVSPRNYAYLYDRIMLKLTGKQRYATQFAACNAGARELRPLEPGHDLAADRKAMGLDTIEDYRATMDKVFGPCPAK